MTQEIEKFCCDRILPEDEMRYQPPSPSGASGGMGPGVLEAIVVKNKMWPNGSTLTVGFLGGTAGERQQVESWAKQWEHFANLKFDFNNAANAQIRVGFVQGDGSWSAVGTDALNQSFFPPGSRTVNFGWELEEGTVLHEFGHAIGMGHEHQNPAGGLQWNEQKVIASLRQPPNRWPPEKTRYNVLRKYDLDQINGTAFDPDSIMLYFFPATWTVNGVGTHANEKLSNTDKTFIGSSAAYPRPEPGDQPTELAVGGGSRSADIGQPGEEDLYTFTVKTAGFYTVETVGPTDLVMRLFGPDSRTRLVAEDDDGGAGFNAKISDDLEVGEYLVQVRHFNRRRGTGNYGIQVSRA